jgi:hypothetical protein
MGQSAQVRALLAWQRKASAIGGYRELAEYSHGRGEPS